jgi:predicted nucleotidyltransferase component of viral defense system
MIELLEQRLQAYATPQEKQAQLREYLQELVLKLIEKSTHLTQLAFFGGTALRILYELPRFSEDLDFSQVDNDFDFLSLLHFLKRELTLYGFSVSLTQKTTGAVKNSFIKFEGLLYQLGLSQHSNQLLSIKLEIDTNPPCGYVLQTSMIQRAFLMQIQHFDKASLFAGKCHALLCRPYPKGRDYFDLLWFIGNQIVPNYGLLSNAYLQTENKDVVFDLEILKDLLSTKIRQADFAKVIADVDPFLIDQDALKYFTSESFLSVLLNWQPRR